MKFAAFLMVISVATASAGSFSFAEAPSASVSVGAATAQASTASKLPTPELETLPNGLQVAWFLNDALPVVDLALLVQSGSRDDEEGKSGTAGLLSRVLDRGAAGMTAQQLALAVEELGASRMIEADDDSITLGMHGLAPDAPALLELLSKIALKPDIPETEVKRELARSQEGLQHIGDYGEALVGLAFERFLRNGTSYSRGSIASVGELSRLTREDLVAFHRKNFTPKNSLLVVVGRVKREEFRARILAAFGGWTGEVPPRSYKDRTERKFLRNTPEIILIPRPSLTQAQVKIGFRAPLIKAPEHYSLVVMNALLGEYFNSRLNSLIRDKLGLTYGVSSSFSYEKEFASFSITSSTRNEAVGTMLKRTLEVVEGLKKEAVPADEVRMAKEYLTGGFPLGTATLGAVASRWVTGRIFGMGPDYLNEFIPRVSAVTPADVNAAAAKDLDLGRVLITIAGDADEIEKSLKKEGYKKIRIVRVADLM